jgi:hypothetical protein
MSSVACLLNTLLARLELPTLEPASKDLAVEFIDLERTILLARFEPARAVRFLGWLGVLVFLDSPAETGCLSRGIFCSCCVFV